MSPTINRLSGDLFILKDSHIRIKNRGVLKKNFIDKFENLAFEDMGQMCQNVSKFAVLVYPTTQHAQVLYLKRIITLIIFAYFTINVATIMF